jgi:tripartite-type tricarboxylate transporter receptor subunit TctC
MSALLGACAFTAALLAAGNLHAQAYPARSVTLINPYPPGGGADIVARALAKELAEQWKQPVLVDNKPGAGTTIGAAFVARAPADGYTLLLSTTQHAVAPALFKSLSYDFLTSLAPIAVVSDSPFFLVVHPDKGINSVADLIARLKSTGSSMNFGSSGPGSLPHLAGAFMNQLTGAQASHIPYSGTAPALTAVLGGQVDYLFADTSALPQVAAGKAKALAVTSAARTSVLPSLPALSEQLPGFALTVWTALEAPAGTPRPVIDQLNAAVYKALATPGLRKQFAENARQVVTFTPEQFAAFKAAEVQKYQKLAREAGLRAE